MQRVPDSLNLTACAPVKTVSFSLSIAGRRKAARRAATPAVPDVEILGADALGVGDIHVVQIGHPAGSAGVDEGGRDRVEIPGALDVHRPARPAELVRTVLPVLRLLEQGQDRLEIPAVVTGFRPAVVVGPVAARPEHRIDAPGAAEDLAPRQGERAIFELRARRRRSRPSRMGSRCSRSTVGGFVMLATPSSVPPASSTRTVASVPSTRRRATTQPADPAPMIT